VSSRQHILIVEDSPALAYTYSEYLKSTACRISLEETGAGALAALSRAPPHVMLLDLGLPDMDGMEILRKLGEEKMPTAVIVVTAQGAIEVAIAAMRCGAYDFLVKPFSAERLQVTVHNALERGRLEEIVTIYRETIDRRGYEGFIGASLAMQAVYQTIDAAAPSKASVFITGESGTGKELCAEAIHRKSGRRDGPFVALNCAAIPRDLMESEIFGHAKGAFTGATSDRQGAAARARGGSLFLDEICDMDSGLQSKLLRLIQTGTFQQVGGNRIEQADVRFIAATNRDPVAEVRAGRFREDLFYRLHVIPIHLPPLREREGDVLELAEAFLKRYAGEERKAFRNLSADACAALAAYPWPGNVRQLENVIRSAVVLNQGVELTRAMLPAMITSDLQAQASGEPARTDEETRGPADASVLRPLSIQEREIIEHAVALCDGNIPRAAAYLDISPSTIYRKKQSW
jgi:two-component system, repressor protein LuxO